MKAGRPKIDAEIRRLARQFSKENPKLGVPHVKSEFAFHKAFDLLVKAKVLHKISSCDPSGLPLGGSRGKKFKAGMLDNDLTKDTRFNFNISLLTWPRGEGAISTVEAVLCCWMLAILALWQAILK